MPDVNDEQVKSLSGALNKLLDEAIPKMEDFSAGFANMIGGAEKLSKQFGIGRQRMSELMGTIAEATPVVDRLGGNLSDAVNTIKSVSEATRRNVVAGTEDISKLYAASKVLGDEYGYDIESLVSSFQEIGVEFTQIGGQLEKSIQYIQGVGANSSQIMKMVLQDMSAINKFNFQNGVEGLTKMAAQAAVLKVDMRTTFDLAERALDPEGAIELSSAFQRLGVNVGTLVDPFQLMNKSLNDPQGLQDSIVEMTKQFTYFDEEAKSFKINPQGMLMMREIQKQTGLAASELSKMALNAADMERKLSQLSPDIKFGSEEDRMLLANVAKMGEGGQYEVKIGDQQVQLEKITQSQLDSLIKQQKDSPKTLEDLQRAQMDTFKVMEGDVRAIKDKVVFGVISAPTIRREAEGARGVAVATTEAIEKNTSMEFFRNTSEGAINTIKTLVSSFQKGGGFSEESLKTLKGELGKLEGLSGVVDEKMRSTIEDFLKLNADNNTEIGKLFQNTLKESFDESELKKTTTQKTNTKPQGSTTFLGKMMTEANTNLSEKVGETNKLTDQGNKTLGDILGELKEEKVSEVEIKGVLSEDLTASLLKNNELQSANNERLASLTDVMKNFKPTTTQSQNNQNTNVENLTQNIQTYASAIQSNVPNPTDKLKNTVNTNDDSAYTLAFDSSKPATVNVNINLTAPPNMDEKMFDALIDTERIKEKFTNNIISKLEEVEFRPLLQRMG